MTRLTIRLEEEVVEVLKTKGGDDRSVGEVVRDIIKAYLAAPQEPQVAHRTFRIKEYDPVTDQVASESEVKLDTAVIPELQAWLRASLSAVYGSALYINAIKRVRERTQCSLKAAKSIVDELRQELSPSD